MSIIILILFTCLTSIYCSDLYLSVYSITSGNCQLELHASTRERSINDFIYTGPFENIEKVLYNSKNNIEKIKNENHPWVFFSNTCNFSDVKYFSNKTIFIISYECDNPQFFKNSSYYSFASVSNMKEYLDKADTKFHYAKVGKEADFKVYLALGIIFVINMIVAIICKIISNKKMRKNILFILLPIYPLYSILYTMLFVCNMCNLFIIPFGNPTFNIVGEYVILFVHACFKAISFGVIILILQGWMVVNFAGGVEFQRYKYYFLFYDLGFSCILNLSLYFVRITSKLNKYYFKRCLEQVAFMSYLIYSIFKVLIPLYRQMKYEERKGSQLVECMKFKYKRLLQLYIFFGICSILIFVSPFIEKLLIDLYLYDFIFHYTFQVIYEIILCVGVNFIFLSKEFPPYYFEKIIFDYKEISSLIADFVEDEDKNKFSISKITSANLKTSMKKGYPILFINPFTSTKNLFPNNQLYLGIATNNK